MSQSHEYSYALRLVKPNAVGSDALSQMWAHNLAKVLLMHYDHLLQICKSF